jgi:hypothetical protein
MNRFFTLLSRANSRIWTTELKIKEKESVLGYYSRALKSLSRTYLHHLTPIFIDCIDPSKTKNNPYSGGEDSKPYWWPAKTRHLKPSRLPSSGKQKLSSHTFIRSDYLLENILLLIEILSNHQVSTTKLSTAGWRKLSHEKYPKDLNITDEILKVRHRVMENPGMFA